MVMHKFKHFNFKCALRPLSDFNQSPFIYDDVSVLFLNSSKPDLSWVPLCLFNRVITRPTCKERQVQSFLQQTITTHHPFGHVNPADIEMIGSTGSILNWKQMSAASQQGNRSVKFRFVGNDEKK